VYGLQDVADMETVERALEKPTGVPIPIVGSHLEVVVNGRPVRLALAPTPVSDDWLVPAGPLLAALGGRTEIGPGANYVVLQRGSDRIFFSPGDPEAIVNGRLTALPAASQLAAGYPLVPVKATAKLLGSSVGWDEEEERVLVWDGDELGRTSTAERIQPPIPLASVPQAIALPAIPGPQ
jgi:hypothetical protein